MAYYAFLSGPNCTPFHPHISTEEKKQYYAQILLPKIFTHYAQYYAQYYAYSQIEYAAHSTVEYAYRLYNF